MAEGGLEALLCCITDAEPWVSADARAHAAEALANLMTCDEERRRTVARCVCRGVCAEFGV